MQFFQTDGFKSSEGKITIASLIVYVAAKVAGALGFIPATVASQLEGVLWTSGAYAGWRTIAKVGGALADAWKAKGKMDGLTDAVAGLVTTTAPDIDPVIANDRDVNQDG